MINDLKTKFQLFEQDKISLKEALKSLPIGISLAHQDSYWQKKRLIIGLDGWTENSAHKLWRIMHELSHLAQAGELVWKKKNWGLDNLEYKSVDSVLFIESQTAAFQLNWIEEFELELTYSVMNSLSLDLSDLGKGCNTLTSLAKDTKINYIKMINRLNKRLFDA